MIDIYGTTIVNNWDKIPMQSVDYEFSSAVFAVRKKMEDFSKEATEIIAELIEERNKAHAIVEFCRTGV